jgi:hypothetical protein
MKVNNRKEVQRLCFKEEGTFRSMYAAERWLKENGYSYGSTCNSRTTAAPLPVAIQKGEYDLPQKWIHFEKEDMDLVDGIMISPDFREGDVTIILFELLPTLN